MEIKRDIYLNKLIRKKKNGLILVEILNFQGSAHLTGGKRKSLISEEVNAYAD